MKVESNNIMLPGAIGEIEAIIDSRSANISNQYIGVCCHPHPQHGGAMANKVIYTASRTLASLGISSIRFNFRGVGKSHGEYAGGIGEQDDLVAVVQWVKENYPEHQLILAGFSFGSHISAMQAVNLGCCLLLSIAPPIGRIELKGFERPNCPWLIIQGNDDELVDADQVEKWSESFAKPPELNRMPGTSHFFHGKLVDLRLKIESFVSNQLNL